MSNQFAKAATDKWSDVAHSLGHAEAPLLAGALAHFECAPYAQYDGGDHVIFVGRVVRFSARDDEEPLVFFPRQVSEPEPAGWQRADVAAADPLLTRASTA